ncbi:L-rhamnose/proton symporter RhaT [Cysteiniphilum sp. JM-1]|uniref:L-rhamnose/proton symporter RhaT n=1 Tax=Cysteiniphilum sp. JM-1 TaxID=2610891 RepID=UPI001246A6F3|nr:L-rhamnose/proton symporter RhaT [Cysteiniphilum sp. JM-1]
MTIISALFFSILAGILNGSFATPTKHMQINPVKMWLNFAFWGFIIIPLVTFLIVYPAFFSLLLQVPTVAIAIPLIAGLIWGIGMVCLSVALKHIGIGVAFVINIGIGTAGGTLIPLIFFPQQQLSTGFVSLVIVAVVFLLVGVLLAGLAAQQREKETLTNTTNKATKVALFAILITIFAGISSALQGASYAYALSAYATLTNEVNSPFILAILPWFFVFVGGFIPYVIYFAMLNAKTQRQTQAVSTQKMTLKDQLLIIAMAVMFFESTVCYAKASQILGALGPIIAWPLFMTFIILMSNFWGLKHGEWRNASRAAGIKIISAIILLIVAVITLVGASLFR